MRDGIRSAVRVGTRLLLPDDTITSWAGFPVGGFWVAFSTMGLQLGIQSSNKLQNKSPAQPDRWTVAP
ncbi:hypothetical protein AAFF_G00006800 [Aldrovandia affinis]|uniref:Uncharacterized protein n=1 Tax=Aldrovandia affinis TaxID=143900 RepID=A0AAD7TG69_9TELE|nr:hypothetical protein AAFF_G00006800 [Aldrovandia affinis]